MKSLGLTAYGSIIASESYGGLRKAIRDIQSQINSRTVTAKNSLNEYMDSNEDNLVTEFLLHDIRDECMDCSEKCRSKHYPILTFTVFFDATGEEEFFATLTIDLNKSYATLDVTANKSDIKLCSAKTNLKTNKWTFTPNDDRSFEEDVQRDVTKFIEELDPLVDIYINALDRVI